MGKDIFNFKLDWDCDDVLRALDEATEEVIQAIEQGLIEDAEELVTAAKALAPHDTGDLEGTITRGKVKSDIDGSRYITAGANTPYALRRHEEPPRKGVHPKYGRNAAPDYYVNGRGKLTRSKPTYMGMRPGRKYLEKPLKKLSNKFMQNIADKVRGKLK